MNPLLVTILIISVIIALIIILKMLSNYLANKCKHEYKLEKEIVIDYNKQPCKIIYIYKCTKCPKFRKITIKG